MTAVFDRSTLVIIPCCAAKAIGGHSAAMEADPLKDTVSSAVYGEVLRTRACVLGLVRENLKFISNKYAKNARVADGPDFGTSCSLLTMPALERYEGSLYRTRGLKEGIRKAALSNDGPRILILSALYGPLHPFSHIQDYNLIMSDAPAKPWTATFSRFLEDYVEHNEIRSAGLYVGSSTAYFKIAKKAIAPLIASGRLKKASQYHVTGGSTRETPKRHGALLAAQLTGSDCSPLFAGDKMREVWL